MKAWIWSVSAVLALTGVIVAGTFWSEARTSARLSGETEAVGLTATPTEWYDSGDEANVRGHTLTYAYAVGDVVYTRTLEQITWYDSAAGYKVCYNPDDAEDSRLYPGDHACGS
jgi:hypothetical protein